MAGIEVGVAGYEGSRADLEPEADQAVDAQLAAQSLQRPALHTLDRRACVLPHMICGRQPRCMSVPTRSGRVEEILQDRRAAPAPRLRRGHLGGAVPRSRQAATTSASDWRTSSSCPTLAAPPRTRAGGGRGAVGAYGARSRTGPRGSVRGWRRPNEACARVPRAARRAVPIPGARARGPGRRSGDRPRWRLDARGRGRG
jgi:hypothetical protein